MNRIWHFYSREMCKSWVKKLLQGICYWEGGSKQQRRQDKEDNPKGLGNLGILPNRGEGRGGVFPIPKTFLYLNSGRNISRRSFQPGNRKKTAVIPPFMRPPIVYVASHPFNNQTPDSGRKREALEKGTTISWTIVPKERQSGEGVMLEQCPKIKFFWLS